MTTKPKTLFAELEDLLTRIPLALEDYRIVGNVRNAWLEAEWQKERAEHEIKVLAYIHHCHSLGRDNPDCSLCIQYRATQQNEGRTELRWREATVKKLRGE